MTRTCKRCERSLEVEVAEVLCRVRIHVKKRRRAYFVLNTKRLTGGRAWHGRVCPDCKQQGNRSARDS